MSHRPGVEEAIARPWGSCTNEARRARPSHSGRRLRAQRAAPRGSATPNFEFPAFELGASTFGFRHILKRFGRGIAVPFPPTPGGGVNTRRLSDIRLNIRLFRYPARVVGPDRPASPLHVHRDGDADRPRDAVRAAAAWRPTSFPRSTSRSSASSGTTTACRPRKWDSASPRRTSAASPPRSATSSTSNRTSLAGITVIKVFFQPTANIQTAIAQVVAAEQTQVRQLPPGITPPLVIKYSASSIPVIQLGLSSPTLPEQVAVRSRRSTAAAAAHHDSRRGGAVSLWRQEPPDFGRPRHAGAAGARPVAGRRGQRDQRAEPDPAVGHRQVRRHRIHGHA